MRNTKNTIITLILVIILAYGLAEFATRYIIASIPIEGSSMEPTVHHEDKAIVYRRAKLDYGDIIIFFSPEDEKHLIKRVIGLEGDTIEIKEYQGVNYVFRNDEMLIEDYIKEEMSYTHSAVVIGEGEFYYLGDNRNYSLDSHFGNLGKVTNIVGQVFLRINLKKFDFELLV